MRRFLGVLAAGSAYGFVLAALTCAPTVSASADMPQCTAPAEAMNLEHLPAGFRLRIAQRRPIKIVAIGSSSTFGTGASSPDKSYPAQLEAGLKAKLPGIPITVLNKGIGGEEAEQMLARFDADVIDETPDLVLWQVGSNSVLANHPAPGDVIRRGVEKLKASGTDVILVNPQYAPKIIAKSGVAEHSVDVITATARDEEVGLFNRFEVMRYWRDAEKLPFEQFVTADGLHMNDWGYGCIAKLLTQALLDGTRQPAATAAAPAEVKTR